MYIFENSFSEFHFRASTRHRSKLLETKELKSRVFSECFRDFPNLARATSWRAARGNLRMTRRSFVGLLRKRSPFGRHSGVRGDSSWRRSSGAFRVRASVCTRTLPTYNIINAVAYVSLSIFSNACAKMMSTHNVR